MKKNNRFKPPLNHKREEYEQSREKSNIRIASPKI